MFLLYQNAYENETKNVHNENGAINLFAVKFLVGIHPKT